MAHTEYKVGDKVHVLPYKKDDTYANTDNYFETVEFYLAAGIMKNLSDKIVTIAEVRYDASGEVTSVRFEEDNPRWFRSVESIEPYQPRYQVLVDDLDQFI